jgi:hypothetical protein
VCSHFTESPPFVPSWRAPVVANPLFTSVV